MTENAVWTAWRSHEAKNHKRKAREALCGGLARGLKTENERRRAKMRNEFERAIFDAVKNLKGLALELESEPGCLGESFKGKLYELSVWADTAWSEYNRYWQALSKEAAKEGIKALQQQGYNFERITIDGTEFTINDLGKVEEVDEIPF
jgi:hypothetical protein